MMMHLPPRHLRPTLLPSSPPGKWTGANRSLFSSATKVRACPTKSSAAPTLASTFPRPAALSLSTPLLPPRSSSTKPPAKETPFPRRTSNHQTLRVLQENREPLLQTARIRRGLRRPRRQPASRRAHAPAHAGRIHRPGKPSRPRQAAAHSNRVRQHRLDAFLGTARLRQNHACPRHRSPHARRFRFLQCRPRRIKEIKEVMAATEYKARSGYRTIVFVDEVHRFNKAQQDAFLPHVEAGHITFIGATTENPSFEVISPLLSRTKVYVLEPLATPQIVELLRRALADKERGFGNEAIEVSDDIPFRIASFANGDARIAYNTLELAVKSTRPKKNAPRVITSELLEDILQRKLLRYDKAGEEHFNLISALHKSVRNSDPDAALYW